MNIVLNEGNLHVSFRVNDDKTVHLVDFSVLQNAVELEKHGQFLSAHVTGETSGDFHAGKHNRGSVSTRWQYIHHTLSANAMGTLLTLSVKAPNGLAADYCMQTYTGLSIVRTWSTLTNESDTDLGLEYVSSFIYQGISKDGDAGNYDRLQFYIPHNSWCNEAQWQQADAIDLGLAHLPIQGYNQPSRGDSRYHYGSNDSWSSCEYLPVGIVRDPATGEVFFGQVEHSGAWEIEYGAAEEHRLYACLLGPNNESAWWKNLKPGQSFTTVPAAFGVAIGDVSEAVAQLTAYRRLIRRPNQDDVLCNVVFNDYMNCLFGNPTEENVKPVIDRAAALGCEYYCMDCGWYDDGNWWDRVGEWKESRKRFPHGLKAVLDYARSKGLKTGLWLEIESMGTKCELTNQLPDDWFICHHGRRRVENQRYLLDFRNPAVRQYCTDVVDRLIRDYGCEYFKIDYNVTTGLGSDLYADSMGDAMLEHYRALYDWIRGLYAAHPGLVIENCGSGGQRMDYGMLSLHSLQSTSDQMDYISNAYIAANVASAVTPEQAGMWVYPYVDDREHVIFNMVNGLLLRPYISGIVWSMSDAQMEVFREGISVYKAIRQDVCCMLPFFPLGFGRVNDGILAYGLRNEQKAYLSVFAVHQREAEIPLTLLNAPVSSVRVIYPATEDCTYRIENNILKVQMPGDTCARLFELTLE